MKPWTLLLTVFLCGCIRTATGASPGAAQPPDGPSLAETRTILDKWIEIQQVIARERKDWQQARDTLESRLELARKEASTVEEKFKQADAASATTVKQRESFVADNEKLKQSVDRLAAAVTRLENSIRQLFPTLPDHLQAKLKPLYDRMPADAGNVKVSVAERFQNILGILSEAIKANNEIPVIFEVHNLSNGKPAEVRVLYVGLSQAYYLSASGEAGIGRPGPSGWKWEPMDGLARDVLKAIEIQAGKRPPAFVSLPVVIE